MPGPLTTPAAALVPSGSTARRDLTTRSYLIWPPPAEARVCAQRPVSHGAYRLSSLLGPGGPAIGSLLSQASVAFRITDEFGACSSSKRRRIVSACLRKGFPMSGVRVLVGTRKGAFVLRSDGK